SGSGQTLFVEPFAVVEDSNRLREAESAEREEVARILRELSRAVGDRADAIVGLVQAIGAIDLAFACARLSRRWRGTEGTRSGSAVRRGARHPLLDPATAVPIDLEPGALRAVVISGPNTGGKTVALKTVGLAAILNQCGMRPPAAPVEVPGVAPAVRAAAPGRARRASRVRPRPGRHRRRAIHRDEPLDVLGARPQPGDDP